MSSTYSFIMAAVQQKLEKECTPMHCSPVCVKGAKKKSLGCFWKLASCVAVLHKFAAWKPKHLTFLTYGCAEADSELKLTVNKAAQAHVSNTTYRPNSPTRNVAGTATNDP